ncbi:hypothetical protein FDF29_11945 [Clostridium botulinum]|uniref:Phage protein n=3 Tax=Clostridium botulinum TaxID=1491 RepID=A5I2I2_CLOBH|nr:hypothetical protein [Clostridium botulinum]ACQ53806.1 hypothetical protein CLJ_B1802 [Clostridium botulinum Ba4 str. 657]NEZ93710.1 hypothetical protein [Clostridium botulinum]NFL68389.1 hypothetical protein [Clostridium botulinum]NFQ52568.1 hypothetical protein [Clostridium botulinum]NFT46948.1 hypothetical protein [Clostridium botulinum]
MEIGILRAKIIPYKTFKERIRLVRENEIKYKVENMDGFLYMVRRN